MSVPDRVFMIQAIAQAREGLERGELPIGAVIVLDNTVIAEAYTGERTMKRRLVHAELLALEMADRMLPFAGLRREAKLFTTLEPCMMCLAAAATFGIVEIHFALESPADGASRLRNCLEPGASSWAPIPSISGGLLRQSSLELFRAYCERFPSAPTAAWARSIAALK